jgi:lactoylglutathione lyase
MIQRVIATVLFVRDRAKCAEFYRDALKMALLESDEVSNSFRLGDQILILLEISAAAELLNVDANALKNAGGYRGLLAASVADVDAAYEELTAKGVTFLRPPTDQSWGLRTAHFVDPEGNTWEINQPIAP